MSEYLTFTQIKEADDIATVDVEMPEWGGKVKVRSMTARERSLLHKLVSSQGDNFSIESANKFALLTGIVEPKLTQEEVELILSEKSGAAVERIVKAFNKLSGLSEEAVLEARGNS